ncbi:MAG: DUF192 domain-containing protein [Nanoarchaeota archaeon]|nr:DUF192 domain-containing protein [Nanoarchaeota archaeon]
MFNEKSININFLNKSVKLDVKNTNTFTKFTGLMFKNKHYKNLLFEFRSETKTPIHSLFVFFPFLVLWLDSRNRVVERKIVKSFSLSVRPKKCFRKIVEIPINNRNKKIINFLMELPF